MGLSREIQMADCQVESSNNVLYCWYIWFWHSAADTSADKDLELYGPSGRQLGDALTYYRLLRQNNYSMVQQER